MLYLKQVQNHANSRFIVQSWKSQVADTENPSSGKNKAQSQESKQTQLRETRDSAAEAWPKLDVTSLNQTLFFISFSNKFYNILLGNENGIKNCSYRT